jgi:pilus assembly protein CpaF
VSAGTPWVSPLLEIERAVLESAKAEALDPASEEGRAGLRRLVEDAVSRFCEEHRRGLRQSRLADPARVVERVLRDLAGYGPLEPLLADDDVWEIQVNAPDAIFVRRHRGLSGYHDEVFHDDDHVLRTLTKILDDAAGSHRKLDPTEGLQDAQLDNGARLHIVHSDIGRDGHVLVNIRKFTGLPLRRLEELVACGTLDETVAGLLRACVRARLSIVFAGPPGSGKTTLLSCCAAELDPRLRVVVAEEVFETDIPLPNVAHMQTRPARADRAAVDLRRLVAGFLRMAPDVAVVGEVRDQEALPLLLTLSSGVAGYTTIHASSARHALTRLRFISQLGAGEVPFTALTHLVSEAIDIVVHCSRHGDRVEVDEVVAVEDLQTAEASGAFTVTELFRRAGPGSPLRWTGNLPVRAGRALEAAGIDVLAVIDPRRSAVSASEGRPEPEPPSRHLAPEATDAAAPLAWAAAARTPDPATSSGARGDLG